MIRSTGSFFLVFLSLSFHSLSQNLISNGDFETYTALPLNYGDFCLVTGWINPSGCCILNPNFGTPDYINRNATWPVGAPNNGFGTISPRSGDGIVGFTTYANYGTPPVFREYITKKLNNHLVTGQAYIVSFYIARASNPFFKYATNNIGVYLSTTAPVQSGTAVISVTPQWEYSSVFSGNSWTLMTFSIIPTDTFNFITIGNFKSDALTIKTTINSSATGLYSHYFIDDVSLVSASPLPVELLSFEVKNALSGVRILWNTASEKNNDYFSVERSRDLSDFMEILRLNSNHTSNILQSYQAFDENPIIGVSYYRLKSVDFDGAFIYSEIRSITCNTLIQTTNVWYEKINNKIYLNMNSHSVKNTSIILYDIHGRQCYLNTTINGVNLEIDTSNLPKGIYTISMNDESKVSAYKVLVF